MMRFSVTLLVLGVGLWMAMEPGSLSAADPASEMSMILSNGPTATRINVVLLAEGYQDNERSKFHEDAQRVVDGLLSAEPLRSYAGFYNAFGIFVASEESGSSHPASGVLRRTYFNSSYDSFGTTRLITIPPNDRNPRYADGEGKAMSLLSQWMPEYDLVAILVNDSEYGGSGGGMLVVSTHQLSGSIAVHEQGHTFAKLGDEYSDPYPAFPDVEEPNTTRETQRARVKWRDWIDDSTPVPTPAVRAFGSVVGLFEGAHYHETGWYRPRLNCAMHDLASPFCEVCSEAIDLAVHRALGSMDQLTPPSQQPITVSVFGDAEFVLSPVLPSQGDASVSWELNGVAVSTTDPLRLLLSGTVLTEPTNQLTAHYQLNSPFVRTDPAHVLEGTVKWMVLRDTQPPPRLVWTWNRAGDLKVSWPLSAEGYVLETSNDLSEKLWKFVPGLPTQMGDRWEQSFPTHDVRRYYRLRRSLTP